MLARSPAAAPAVPPPPPLRLLFVLTSDNFALL